MGEADEGDLFARLLIALKSTTSVDGGVRNACCSLLFFRTQAVNYHRLIAPASDAR